MNRQMHYYGRVWQDFLESERTLPTTKRNFTEWHKGRHRFAVWGVAVDSGPVVGRLNEARDRLSPFLVDDYDRGAHVTLYVCGFMTQVPQAADDYDGNLLSLHLSALEKLELRPFSLEVLGVNSFESAPFLEVVDTDNMLGSIRNALISVREEDRRSDYTPHITIGLYSDAFSCKELDSAIRSMGKYAAFKMDVQSVALMTYDTRDVGSPLIVEHEIRL